MEIINYDQKNKTTANMQANKSGRILVYESFIHFVKFISHGQDWWLLIPAFLCLPERYALLEIHVRFYSKHNK